MFCQTDAFHDFDSDSPFKHDFDDKIFIVKSYNPKPKKQKDFTNGILNAHPQNAKQCSSSAA